MDLEQLDEPFWKLGKGLQYLDKAVVNTIGRHDIVSTDEILQRADEVMYEYKRKHKEKYLKQLEK